METIASYFCGLIIKSGGLYSAEGRLIVTPPTGGTIRVNDKLQNERKRFTIAHEIGHYILHKDLLLSNDTRSELNTWSGKSIETEANIFAAELLMPFFLLEKKFANFIPSWNKIFHLAAEFQTSKMATAIQIIEYYHEPCALIFSYDGQVKWCKYTQSFQELGYFIDWKKEIHKDTVAFEMNQDNKLGHSGMHRVFAYSWLDRGFSYSKAEVKEDSWKFDNGIMSIIFIEDDI